MDLQEQITYLKAALEREKSSRIKAERQLERKSSDLSRMAGELRETHKQIKELASVKIGSLGVTDEIELNTLLEEQRNQIKILLNNSSVGIVLTKDGGHGAVLSNSAACKILGYTEEELKYKNVGTSVYPDDIPKMQKEFHLLHQGKKDEFSLKPRLITKEGKIIWTRFSGAAVRDASGNVKYEVVTFEDITREKRLRDRLSQSESLLANLFTDMPIGMLIENQKGKVVLANKRFCSIFDLEASPEQMVGSDSRIIVEKCKLKVKETRQFIQQTEHLRAQKSLHASEEIVFVDGRVFERDYIPLSYLDNYTGCLWSYKEITEIKGVENQLQQQKEKYTTIIENMNLGWTESDRNGHLLTANKRFCELSGYRLEELVGKQGAELLFADTSRERIGYYQDLEQKVYESRTIQIKTKSGELKHVLVSGLRTYNSKGELDGSIGILFDITDQKKLELQKEKLLKELEAQNEQLNDYAHVVSHDLKSPLHSISALLAWTKEDFSEDLGEAGLENLNLIEERVDKMDMLIENILNYSRLDNTQLNNINIDLNVTIQEVLGMMFVPKNVQIAVAKLPVIVADAARMQQLFQNLIGNAVNHVDQYQGKIKIDCIDTETHYRFAIKDNGRGIKKEYHDKIFKAFKSFDDRDRSTGIGLSIVKKIINQYAGEIWFESEVGLGTTFFFTLKKQL